MQNVPTTWPTERSPEITKWIPAIKLSEANIGANTDLETDARETIYKHARLKEANFGEGKHGVEANTPEFSFWKHGDGWPIISDIGMKIR